MQFVDKVSSRRDLLTLLSVSGNLAMLSGMSLVGPLRPLPLRPSRLLAFVAAAYNGVGYAVGMVASIARSKAAAVEGGFPDDLNTFLVLTGTKTANSS